MRHLITKINPDNKYKVAILIKEGSFNMEAIKRHYITPLVAAGIAEEDIISFTLKYNEANKAPVSLQKTYLEGLGKGLNTLNTEYLLITDGAYFKTICGIKKADAYYGYILQGSLEQFTKFRCVLSVNQSALFYNPTLKEKLVHSINTLVTDMSGDIVIEPGHDVFHNVTYPSFLEIDAAIENLHQYDTLAIDIEGFSLRFNKAKIATISFAWNAHDGIAFDVQHTRNNSFETQKIYEYLHWFFYSYKGKLVFHNCAYDAQVIIYELFMKDYLDTEGMYLGLKCLFKDLDDTKILTYLATNSAVGNKLDLKSNVQEYLGNYAVDDINDITKIPIDELLVYNMADALGTFWLKDKMMPKVIVDDQLNVYQEIMQPSMRTICQMQLTGMPLNMDRVLEVQKELLETKEKYSILIQQSIIVREFRLIEMESIMKIANKKLKKKVRPLSDFEDYEFNPGSNQQVARLLHNHMQREIIDRTAKGAPSVGGDTLKKHLISDGLNQEGKELIEALIELTAVNKILNTFIKAFIEYSVLKEDGVYWLHGNFNLGGTVSGRLSSSNPNLQNLPSNSVYGKLIKSCFTAPPGWIMAGADFNSLEDMISALTTKDPNKLKVYMGVKIYELTINDICHHIRDDDTINFNGKSYTGEVFYEQYTNGLL